MLLERLSGPPLVVVVVVVFVVVVVVVIVVVIVFLVLVALSLLLCFLSPNCEGAFGSSALAFK